MSNRLRSPTVSAEWLRALADLVEQGKCRVIKCEMKPRGVMLGVVKPEGGEDEPLEMAPVDTGRTSTD